MQPDALRKRRFVYLLTIVLVVVIGLEWLSQLSMPSYKGRTVGSWFADYRRAGHDSAAGRKAFDALVSMGAEAAPFLAGQYVKQDNVAERALSGIAIWLAGTNFLFTSENARRSAARTALYFIGTNARPSGRLILEVLKNPQFPDPSNAVGLMAHIQTDPDLLIPELLRCLRSDRHWAATVCSALICYGREARSASPALCELVREGRTPQKVWASTALLAIGDSTELAFQTVSNALLHGATTDRICIPSWLQTLPREKGKIVMPLLLKALSDEHEAVRMEATGAVQRLAPEMLKR